MILKSKLRQHSKRFAALRVVDGMKQKKKMDQALFSPDSKATAPPKPVTLAPVGGPTLAEIEAKYGPIRAIKRQV